VEFAYQLPGADAIKGPAWIHDGRVRFSLTAVAPHPESATGEDLLAMLRVLIEERFKAKIRIDFKQVDGYALVVSRGALRISKSNPEGPRETSQTAEWPRTLTAHSWTMESLAKYLESVIELPTVDETGLKGAYDFTLTIESGDAQSWMASLRSTGLALQRRKVPVPYATIESAELPSGN
jgi:uncharacterized protein (TIGR03435 family)